MNITYIGSVDSHLNIFYYLSPIFLFERPLNEKKFYTSLSSIPLPEVFILN